MKTYEQLLDEVVTSEYHRINPVAVNIHRSVAKRYAKQWVEEAADIAMAKAEIGQPVGNAVLSLLKEIDAQ